MSWSSPSPIALRKSSSFQISIPYAFPSANFEPDSAPQTRISKFFVTEAFGVPPALMTFAFASFRVIPVILPVTQTVFPARDLPPEEALLPLNLLFLALLVTDELAFRFEPFFSAFFPPPELSSESRTISWSASDSSSKPLRSSTDSSLCFRALLFATTKPSTVYQFVMLSPSSANGLGVTFPILTSPFPMVSLVALHFARPDLAYSTIKSTAIVPSGYSIMKVLQRNSGYVHK
mmetsp:Transcript_3682/g.8753  ORF Transcript_3682/g.8753 Transcript_3682/m.8753 type:complete len:234 (+) Transcript_3682:748-1449(+)